LSALMLFVNLRMALPTLGLTTAAVLTQMVRSMLAASLMAGCVWLVRGELAELHAGARLAIGVATGVAVYASVTLLVNRAATTEAFQLLFGGISNRAPSEKLP
jgi:hypothetical protein